MFVHHHHHLLLALLVSLSSEIFEMCNTSWQPLLICFTSTLPPSSAFHFHFFTFFTKHFLPTLQYRFYFQASFLLCISLSLSKLKTFSSAFHVNTSLQLYFSKRNFHESFLSCISLLNLTLPPLYFTFTFSLVYLLPFFCITFT